MTWTTTEQLPPFAGGPGTSSFARSRDARVLEHARERAADALGGRTVWCIGTLPTGIVAAQAVHACLVEPADDRVAARRHVPAVDPTLHGVGERLDAMLHGAVAAPSPPDPDARAAFAAGVERGEARLPDGVGAGDVVVLHDAVAATLAPAARARGAHVVRHLPFAPAATHPAATAARAFLAAFERDVDAYVADEPPTRRAGARRWLATALPAPGHVAITEVTTPDASGAGLCWRTALAALLVEDREEHAGGTVRPRPVVAAR